MTVASSCGYGPRIAWAASLAIAFTSASSRAEVVPSAPGEAQLEQLVEANIIAVHAYQVQLARKQGNVDFTCWPSQEPSDT